MASTSAHDLVAVIGKAKLLSPEQLKQLQAQAAKFPDAKTLAKELVRGGWLTHYQVGQLAKGGRDLFLDPYILLDKLGEGGMGAVFKAKHATLGRIVALKLIRKERLTNPDAIKRFYREIRAAAQLEHPNVVRAFDADEVDGTHFFVMEFVEGDDLAKIVKDQGPLPIATACDYIRQAALGLQHAFERGMVHRDIKPANLLVAEQAGKKLVKILDMGLARTRTEEHDESTALTQEGSVMGTPDYIAPEQAISSHEVDIRADIYSLGCSFYYLLTGKVPFPGGSMTEKLLKHQMDEPVPANTIRPEIPLGVLAILRKAIAKKPADRFQTPAELAVALADYEAYAQSLNQETVSIVSTGIPRPNTGSDTVPDVASQWADMVTPTVTEFVTARPSAPPAEKTRPAWMPYAIGGAGVFVVLVIVVIWLGGRGQPAPPPVVQQPPPKKAPIEEPPKPAPVVEPPPQPVAAVPPPLTPGARTLIFNGKDLAGWKTSAKAFKGAGVGGWMVGTAKLSADKKTFVVDPNGTELINNTSGANLYTDQEFGDCIIEVDVMVAEKANSGLYIMGEYEIQIFDSFGKPAIDATDMGALYNAAVPREKACKPPGEWQTLRIEFRAPRFEGNRKTENAWLQKVILNRKVIHENVEITKVSGQSRTGQERVTGPVYLQGDHGGGVAWRNFRVTRPATSFLAGNDLKAWSPTGGSWQLQGGVLQGSIPATEVMTSQYVYLCSTASYSDFELRFKVRLKDGQGNGGLQFRSRLSPKGGVSGPQADIGGAFWGDLYDQDGAGTIKKASAIDVAKILKPTDFNDYYIRCVDKHVTIRINGLTTIDDDFPKLPATGIIAWQLGRGTELTVKDIEFKIEAPTLRLSGAKLESVKELNTEPWTWLPWLTSDGLTIYWERAGAKVSKSTRKDLKSPFGPAVEIGNGRHPSVTDDGLELFVDAGNQLATARRLSVNEPFPPPMPIEVLRGGDRSSMPAISTDGLTLVFQRRNQLQAEFRFTRRAHRDAPWEPSQPLPMIVPDGFGQKMSWPFVTQDGLILICAHEIDAQSRFMVWKRKSPREPFAEFHYLEVAGIPNLGGRAPRWIERSKELFFTAPADLSDPRNVPWKTAQIWRLAPVDLR